MEFFALLRRILTTCYLSWNRPETKPFATSPRNKTHPHHSKSRVEYDGNEGMTRNAQSRSQTAVPKEKQRAPRNSKSSTFTPGGNKVILNFTGNGQIKRYGKKPHEKNRAIPV